MKIIDFGLAKDIQVVLISTLKILDCSEIQGERGTVAPPLIKIILIFIRVKSRARRMLQSTVVAPQSSWLLR